jgi:ligand-binding sensor domain-containing protein/signal transduction histidine kinase
MTGILISLWSIAAVYGLDPTRNLSQYNCRTWTRENGLPVNGINSIAQSDDGYLWIGTSAGLVRFDGAEFKLIDLQHVPQLRNTIVTSIASARGGGIWLGLDNSGFGFFDGESFSFRGREDRGKVNMNVRSLLEAKDGTLWFAAERLAARLTPSGFYENVLGSATNYTINILCGYEDSRGRLWFGSASQGLYYWRQGKITKVSDPKLDSTPILAIAEDWGGQIWVGTDQGLVRYQADLQKKETFPLPVEVRALFVDRHGILWIGTSGQGILKYQNGTYSSLRKIDGLASDYVRTIAEDREGNLWVGTRDGVSQLTDIKFPIERAAEDPSVQDAWGVGASRDGGIWIGSMGGVSYFDGHTKTYSTESGVPKTQVKRVFEASNGDVYMVSGSRDLLVLSQGKVVTNYTAPNMVVGLAEDSRGVVASVGGELYRVGTNYFTPYIFSNGAPRLEWVLNLSPGSADTIWVACGNGIFRIKDSAWQRWALPGDAEMVVQWICEDDEGTVWAGMQTGIVRLRENQLRPINRMNGLFDDNIFAIVSDDFGNLWIDSGRGIFRIARKSMNDFADGKIDRVESQPYDGPESVKVTYKTVQEHSACKTADGRIWFPSPDGVIVIDPAHIPVNHTAPPVHIHSIRGNGKEFSRTENISVPPGKGELEFKFTALSYVASHKILFRYQLAGYDKDWVEAADRRMAFYTNLKPGKYTFRVIAANADGVWNETGDSVQIALQPHFYQTALFDVLCGLLGIAALMGVYGLQVRRMKRKQQALQEARDLLEAEVRKRTAELQTEVEGHKRTAAELEERKVSLEREMEERERMQVEVERTHKELVGASRQAGMAEVATSVLHNVGNVLNSVNVSTSMAVNTIRKSRLNNLGRLAALVRENRQDLSNFFANDARGKQLPDYLTSLTEHLGREQSALLKEMEATSKHIEHVKEIVKMQQSYAKVCGVIEQVQPADLVEDALRLNATALDRHAVKVVRDYSVTELPHISAERHKVLQVLVNMVANAKYACDESGHKEKTITLRVRKANEGVRISVIDNGVGIPPENMTRIFNHGFTTRKEGHGFGLHSGSLTAKELGGSLTVQSDGLGKGATFTLELPARPPRGDR